MLCSYTKFEQTVNNWDLVDGSAEHIVGAFLMDKSKKPLKGKGLILKKWIHAQIARYLLASNYGT
jgi:3-methyladenine DNA glycosylase AlkD